MGRSMILLWCFLVFFLSMFHQVFSSSSSSEQLCLHDQKSALLQLKHEQSCSNSYDTLESWKPDTICCSWMGVTCDGHTGHVIGLNLSSVGLCGSIQATSGLFHLRHLQTLTLFDNSFNGSISSEFNRLSELTYLDLSGNYFGGQIYANCSIFNLPNLQTLNLSWNSFENSIPYGLDRLSKLTHLDLSYNSFDGQIPLEISQLTNLVSLVMSFNNGLKLENFGLRSLLQNLSSLIELRLDRVDMSHHDNSDWHQSISSMLPKLQQLSLCGCSLSRPMDSSLSKLHSLSELRLGYNNLSSTLKDLLGKFPSLRVLGLCSTELYGDLPDNFFSLQPDLQILDLSDNYHLSGYLPEFPQENSLRFLEISSTTLCRKLPNSIKNLNSLEILSFRNCSLSGPITSILSSFANLTHLIGLLLSDNSLTGQIPSFFNNKFPNIQYLYLGNNLLQGPIPSSFENLPALQFLDLSDNNLIGQIPSFCKNGCPNLWSIHLRNNLLEGPIPSSLLSVPSLSYVDFSHNKFNDILDDFSHNTKLVGNIPTTVYGGTTLEVLDLSYNNLSSMIPRCLDHLVGNLLVLNLERNNLHGSIPATYTEGCKLQMFKVNGNRLQGKLPRSLANCKALEVLDIGNNQIRDDFPFWLQSLPELRVLVMRSNKFYGSIRQKSKVDSPFPMLHVFDISQNHFIGKLPLEYICKWNSMLVTDILPQVDYISLKNESVSYEATLEIVSKGRYMEMEKIIKTLTSIDLSYNQFRGNIPAAIGELKSLIWLNLSANELTGQIPSSLAQLNKLESLDLSKNSLSGEIPQQMGSLTSLSYLNLSQNHLTGMIPQGNQFETFSTASYEGNVGLCGFPLPKRCGVMERALPPASTLEEEQKDSTSVLDWRFVIAGYCSGAITGVVIGHTMFWRIMGCFKLASRLEKFKPKKRSKKSKSHRRVK